MKQLLQLSFALLAASSASAIAADLRVPMKAPPPVAVPLFTWTGFYIGANGGYGGDRFRYDFAVVGVPGTARITSGGGFGGGQIGYNYQVGSWVFGLEGDIQASDIRGRVSAAILGIAANAGSKIDWFATARGRVGYAWDRVLVYATGGYAHANVDTGAGITLPGVIIPGAGVAGFAAAVNVNTSHNGWVAGGGLEYAITNNLTFKTEYQYLDFESKTLAAAGASFIDVKPTVHTVRGGLNWKF
jgi:outer membrane immunogenic protein